MWVKPLTSGSGRCQAKIDEAHVRAPPPFSGGSGNRDAAVSSVTDAAAWIQSTYNGALLLPSLHWTGFAQDATIAAVAKVAETVAAFILHKSLSSVCRRLHRVACAIVLKI